MEVQFVTVLGPLWEVMHSFYLMYCTHTKKKKKKKKKKKNGEPV